MSSALPKVIPKNTSGSERDLDRMKQAAERYRQAMASEKDRERLIEDYLPLVKSIVSRMRHHFPDSYEMEDMYGIGAKALVVSVNQFNPSKGKSFGNYAALRIRGSLLDELRRIDSLPRANRAKAKSLQATIAELEARDKRPPEVETIRKELSLTPSEYEKLLKETQPITFVPIDSSLDRGQSEGKDYHYLRPFPIRPKRMLWTKLSKGKKSIYYATELSNFPISSKKYCFYITMRSSNFLKLLKSLA